MQMQARFTARLAFAALAAALAGGCAAPAATSGAASAEQIQAAIAHPARSGEDRQDDPRYKPAGLLAFARLGPGMKVLEVSAGDGATAALMAAVVGSGGEVWAHTSRPYPKLAARVPALPQIKPFVAPYDDPAPAGAPPFDRVLLSMSYHDIANTPADRMLMNKRIHAALKPGGYYLIIDNAAREGSGFSVTRTLHRIEEAALVAEVTSAGFAVDGRSEYLRVPGDPRDLPYFKMDGRPDDKFAIRFIKHPGGRARPLSP